MPAREKACARARASSNLPGLCIRRERSEDIRGRKFLLSLLRASPLSSLPSSSIILSFLPPSIYTYLLESEQVRRIFLPCDLSTACSVQDYIHVLRTCVYVWMQWEVRIVLGTFKELMAAHLYSASAPSAIFLLSVVRYSKTIVKHTHTHNVT